MSLDLQQEVICVQLISGLVIVGILRADEDSAFDEMIEIDNPLIFSTREDGGRNIGVFTDVGPYGRGPLDNVVLYSTNILAPPYAANSELAILYQNAILSRDEATEVGEDDGAEEDQDGGDLPAGSVRATDAPLVSGEDAGPSFVKG